MPETNLDILWMLLCSFMVLLMQPGFMCLEAGFVRQKNAASVALKNTADLCIVCLVYTFLGFSVMFGTSVSGLFGQPSSSFLDTASPSLLTFFFLQLVFCGTAVTIVSGAVAERIRFVGYCAIAVGTAGVIYPVVGHWIWAGPEIGSGSVGWLRQLGFFDHAGATAVHSVGGWVALAALIVMGQRAGYVRGADLSGSNLPLSMLGLLLLWIGWFGFNAGGVGDLSRAPLIIINTALAGASGGVLMSVYSWRTRKAFRVKLIINGMLAGLVASTAGCILFAPADAAIVGLGGGVAYVIGDGLLRRFGIDDTVGAVPVHLVAGIWGTLSVPFFAPLGSWGTEMSRIDFFGIQLLGVAAVGLFVLFPSLLVLGFMHRRGLLRLSVAEEVTGLDVSELGEHDTMFQFTDQLSEQIASKDFSQPIDVEPQSDLARIGYLYNMAMRALGREKAKQDLVVKHLKRMVNYDPLTGLANRNLQQISIEYALRAVRRNGLSGAVLYIDLDGFKAINDGMGHATGDHVLVEVARRLNECLRETDRVARLGGDEFCVLVEGLHRREEAVAIARVIVSALGEPIIVDGKPVCTGASVGIAHFAADHEETLSTILHKADEAMYIAKGQGKSDYHVYAADADVA
ncbi:MAG: ammonium transporter [Rhodobiaceae bacterium]|nr:MAG: ammonium transporter [Rhodobiaceae bacterium]